ncbi:homocysteine/cysteine synthase [Anaeramoeba flamelloides]|uniref:Homocysteine/cysteine synthase n=1 Tax=Anaeramoeba flamelloides TaxID=1746091 RepID=A0AAV7ZK93_9EUKA|nr:homocysteine/cysteine synthase [Anaeramoeba flamelloides]KAJ6227091.1 homocysteine/cysteine synthase [Anaeramoeba flamelloides]
MENLINKGCTVLDDRYCRSFSKLQESVLKNFQELYSQGTNKQLWGVLTTSGMQAIYNVIDHIINKHVKMIDKIHVLYASDLYCDTERTIKYIQRNRNIKIHKFNITNSQSVSNILNKLEKNSFVVLFFESVSNPYGHVFDFAQIRHYRKSVRKMYIVVDNTWMSGVLFNPFKFDVDIVVNSTSKYYSNGKHIGGVILSTIKQIANTIIFENRIIGTHISPFNLQQILDNWETLPSRIQQSSIKTKKLIAKLKSKSKSKFEITYPFGNELYKKYINTEYGPSLFLVRINKNIKVVKKMMMNQDLVSYSTSYGTPYTKIDSYPFSDPNDNSKTFLRLYVGYDEEDLDLLNKKLLGLFKC